MSLFKKVFFHSPIRYIISLLVVIIITVLFSVMNKTISLFILVNSLSTGGTIVILIGGLSLVSSLGAFDTFGYGFSSFRRGSERKYKDLYEYQQIQAEKRKTQTFCFIPYITVGVFFILISLIINGSIKNFVIL